MAAALMTKFALLVALVGCVCGAALHAEEQMTWEEFKAKHGVRFASVAEDARRKAIFEENVAFINKENSDPTHTYTLGINQFAHLTREEFRASRLGKIDVNNMMMKLAPSAVPMDNLTKPEVVVDWRAKGDVTPVPNEGQCGDAALLASVGAIESCWAIATGRLIPLSTQQVIDCAPIGCEGGEMDATFAYVKKNGGLDSAADYPSSGMPGKCDKTKEAKHVASIRSYAQLPQNESALIASVNQGPITVAIEADQSAFQFYRSGVFSGPCGTNLDHVMLVVGYNSDNKPPYWIARNSWGTSWGNSGYIYMAQGKGAAGLCGINMAAIFPTC